MFLPKKITWFLVFFLVTFFSITSAFAEEKAPGFGGIPKLPKTPNDPFLFDGHVYPSWGPPCQRYTYSVFYRDKEGRPPEYVKIWFNGQFKEMEKENPQDNNYKKGVKYIFKYVPQKIEANFFFFEASNGLGKTRDAIIDSPSFGPVLFSSAFDKNEIAVIEKETEKKILSYQTGKEWVAAVALSDDGRYLAAKTSRHIYFFDVFKKREPLWSYSCQDCQIGGDIDGGIDISGDGQKIAALIGEKLLLFSPASNKPVWEFNFGRSAGYEVAISSDGQYVGVAGVGEQEEESTDNPLSLFSVKNNKPLWQYGASGNFHDVSFSANGDFIAAATGCPDSRFYLFSKNSPTPLIRSEKLTQDSPVDRAKISTDGSLIAVGSESGSGAVFLFSKNLPNPLWKFPLPGAASAKALAFTPSGRYIAVGTTTGGVYLFSKENSQPISSWQVKKGADTIDIADDGSFLAVGTADNKLFIFDKDSGNKSEFDFDEYVNSVDISANGKFIALGTGGSNYFFEVFAEDVNKKFDCSSIKEPEPEKEFLSFAASKEIVPRRSGILGIIDQIFSFLKQIFSKKTSHLRKTEENGLEGGRTICGNTICEQGETKENCPKDCLRGD